MLVGGFGPSDVERRDRGLPRRRPRRAASVVRSASRKGLSTGGADGEPAGGRRRHAASVSPSVSQDQPILWPVSTRHLALPDNGQRVPTASAPQPKAIGAALGNRARGHGTVPHSPNGRRRVVATGTRKVGRGTSRHLLTARGGAVAILCHCRRYRHPRRHSRFAAQPGSPAVEAVRFGTERGCQR